MNEINAINEQLECGKSDLEFFKIEKFVEVSLWTRIKNLFKRTDLNFEQWDRLERKPMRSKFETETWRNF